MEGSAPREPLRGAAATERGFSAPSWDPFVAGTTALLKLGEVRLIIDQVWHRSTWARCPLHSSHQNGKARARTTKDFLRGVTELSDIHTVEIEDGHLIFVRS